MKQPVMRTKSHLISHARHISVLREHLIVKGFVLEAEKGATCKQPHCYAERSER